MWTVIRDEKGMAVALGWDPRPDPPKLRIPKQRPYPQAERWCRERGMLDGDGCLKEEEKSK
jgi:hypothetical protein